MGSKANNLMLSVVWLEGVLDYFNASFPHGPDDPRRIGFGVGRQVIGLYLLEMLLKYALDNVHRPYNRSHNLHNLFSELPESDRRAVESKYSQLLSDGASEIWDFGKSVESFLVYLGEDPMTDSRYFWERARPHDVSIMFLHTGLSLPINALFIALHNYPEGQPLKQRYNTIFIPFEDSLKDRQDPPRPETEREDRRLTPHKFWMEGLLEYFNVRFPHDSEDPREFGFHVGQRIVGLYLTEMLLKYALDDLDRQYGNSHNLHSLFKRLPRPRRRAVEKKYREVLHDSVSRTWHYAQSVESLLQYSGHDPLTDTRYFWEPRGRNITLSPWPLRPLIQALFVELHGYPQHGPFRNRYETQFLRYEDVVTRDVIDR